MTARTKQFETIPRRRFSWNPQLKKRERERYEIVRAEKIQRGEPWRDPQEVRENFVRGYVNYLENGDD